MQPKQRGFILIGAIIFSMVLLTTISLWYRQIILQKYIAERLVENHMLLTECRSLLPTLNNKLKSLDLPAILEAEEGFLILKESGSIRWKINRNAWKNGGVTFIFHYYRKDIEPLRIRVAITQPT